MILLFTHATHSMHGTQLTQSKHETSFSFSHAAQDLLRIYESKILFTHDTLTLISCTRVTQTGEYLCMLSRIYGLRRPSLHLRMVCMVRIAVSRGSNPRKVLIFFFGLHSNIILLYSTPYLLTSST